LAFGGAGYSDLGITDNYYDRDYKSSGLTVIYGAGIEKYFDIGTLIFRYKVMQLQEPIAMRTGETDKPLPGWELDFGIIW
jgi:hypothetical protein